MSWQGRSLVCGRMKEFNRHMKGGRSSGAWMQPLTTSRRSIE